MIVGKSGLENREVKIDIFTYTEVVIEVPEGHEGFGSPNPVENNHTLWPQGEIDRFWRGD
jgi:hypothetical protein